MISFEGKVATPRQETEKGKASRLKISRAYKTYHSVSPELFKKGILMTNQIMTVNQYGTIEYKNEKGELHREDGPAIVWTDGNKFWYLNGKLHREDGPAFEDANGYKAWYLNGQCHREDGPAVEYSNGDKEYYLNGKKLAQIEFSKTIKSSPKKDSSTNEISFLLMCFSLGGILQGYSQTINVKAQNQCQEKFNG